MDLKNGAVATRFGATRLFLIAIGVAVVGMFITAPIPYIIDGAIYHDMARSMSVDGTLSIARNGDVENAPPLTKHLTHTKDGAVYAQYPSGYALIAAPFYKAFGIRGLIALNGISAVAALWFTFQIAGRLFNRRVATIATLILPTASMFPVFAFAIWPHMISLATGLGAILLALKADSETKRSNSLLLFAAAGLAVGLGLTIRIDVFLIAPALFLWLRLFARPDDRQASIALLIGMAPTLLFSAYLNHLKFGVFQPIHYGYENDIDSLGFYLPIAIVAGLAFLVIQTVNTPKLARTALPYFQRRMREWVIAVFLGIFAIFALTPFMRDLLYSAYVLVINLQAHNAYTQVGVEMNEYGQLLFWDYPKKALLQSIPYLPLIILPIYFFSRGQNVSSVALCLLLIAGPISFYSLSQWHGGGSMSMRYFIPTLPFVAILSAFTLTHLADRAGAITLRQVLIAAVAALVSYLLLQNSGRATPPLYVPAALYPQWLIAVLVAGATVTFLAKPGNQKLSQWTLGLSLFAICYAAAINFDEEMSHQKGKVKRYTLARATEHVLDPGSLVITQMPVTMIYAEIKGVEVMMATGENVEEIGLAIAAFQHAGRCVYFQNSQVLEFVPAPIRDAIDPKINWVPSTQYQDDPSLTFYSLAAQSDRCRF